MPETPEPVEQDSRGILRPWMLRERVRLERHAPPPELDGLVANFWTVAWELPPGGTYDQQVLTHPTGNLSIAAPDGGDEHQPLVAELTGVQRALSSRRLVGRAWGVAARTTVGGLGAFLDRPASDLTDRSVPLGTGCRVDEPGLLAAVAAAPDVPARVAVLSEALLGAVDPLRAAPAREVAAVAQVAETDREVRRLADLARLSGIGPRTLQRLFQEHVGVSPTWVIRRYRLLDAVEAVREGRAVVWTDVAAELGYADQAHLVREFKAAVGTTPTAYVAQATSGSAPAGP